MVVGLVPEYGILDGMSAGRAELDATKSDDDPRCPSAATLFEPRCLSGDDAESVAVLAGQEIADDGFAIGLGGIGLVIGDAELTMVVQAPKHQPQLDR
jgi:hypothetical protein